MNKTELIASIAKKAELTNAKAGQALEAFMSSVTESLTSGDGVTIPGFGSFTAVQREARKGRNPQTGAPITIPAKKVVKFKPGKGLDLN